MKLFYLVFTLILFITFTLCYFLEDDTDRLIFLGIMLLIQFLYYLKEDIKDN